MWEYFTSPSLYLVVFYPQKQISFSVGVLPITARMGGKKL